MDHAQNQTGKAPIISAQELVGRAAKLVSLPEACIRINDMIDDPRYSAADIGEVISADPSLTARLLRIVNSSFYGFPSRIDTISRAITIIGVRDLRDLVLATSAVDVFSKVPNELMDMGTFWRHSVMTGVLSRMLAKQCNVLHAERLFVGGLLHDIGSLVMYSQLPEQSRDAMLIAADNPENQWEAENEVFGYNHADVGHELMKLWQLPESLIEMTTYHHYPLRAQDAPLDVALVSLANYTGNQQDEDIDEETFANQIPLAIWELTGLDSDKLLTTLNEANALFAETCSVLLPSQFRVS